MPLVRRVADGRVSPHSDSSMNEGETIELRPGKFTKTCVVKGGGNHPTDGHLVLVAYHGTLDDGTVFDTSRGRKPITFHLGRAEVIKGWDIAVATMTVGEKAIVHIPADCAQPSHTAPRTLVPRPLAIARSRARANQSLRHPEPPSRPEPQTPTATAYRVSDRLAYRRRLRQGGDGPDPSELRPDL